jgi:hypothetical protein
MMSRLFAVTVMVALMSTPALSNINEYNDQTDEVGVNVSIGALNAKSYDYPSGDVEGVYKRVLAMMPGHIAVDCDDDPNSTCFEYNAEERWIKLCDGKDTMIGYVISVNVDSEYIDPETGATGTRYDVQVGTD